MEQEKIMRLKEVLKGEAAKLDEINKNLQNHIDERWSSVDRSISKETILQGVDGGPWRPQLGTEIVVNAHSMGEKMGVLGEELRLNGPQTLKHIEGNQYTAVIKGKPTTVTISPIELSYMKPRYPDRMTLSNALTRPFSTDIFNKRVLASIDNQKLEIDQRQNNLSKAISGEQKLAKFSQTNQSAQTNLNYSKLKGGGRYCWFAGRFVFAADFRRFC
jgi:hypothetical protein